MHTYSKIQIRCAAIRRSNCLSLRQIFGLLVVALAGLVLHPGKLSAGTELLMFETEGCTYCIQWHDEVGGEYPITPEGQTAPLHRLHISEGRNSGYDLVSRPRFTPTFVLVQDGVEVGRIEGYPGEDFFWGLLGRLLDRRAPDE